MYRKNTAGQVIYFTLVNASTGAALTGATVTAYRALDSNAQAAATGTATDLGNGQYRFALSQADTNGDYGSYLFTATNAVPVEKTVVFTGANPTDGVRFGLTALPNAEAGANGGLPTGDASGRVLLQPTQTGVTIPTVTTLTNAPGDSSGVTTLLARLPSAISLSAGAVTVGTNNDKTGYSLATAPPTAAAVAAAVVAYDIGNGRTVGYFLQGGANRTTFAADGLSFTVYATDDTTQLYTGTSTRLATTVGGLASVDPA